MNEADKVPITCPHCGQAFEEGLGNLKDHASVQCPHCTWYLQYEPRAVLAALRDEHGAVDRLRRSFRTRH